MHIFCIIQCNPTIETSCKKIFSKSQCNSSWRTIVSYSLHWEWRHCNCSINGPGWLDSSSRYNDQMSSKPLPHTLFQDLMKRLKATPDYLLLMLPIMVTCSFGSSLLRRTQRQHLLSSGFREDLAALPCLEPSSSMDLSSQQQMRMMYWQELQAILTHGQESIMSSTLTTQLEQVSLIQWFKERLQCFLCSLYYILIIFHRLIGI